MISYYTILKRRIALFNCNLSNLFLLQRFVDNRIINDKEDRAKNTPKISLQSNQEKEKVSHQGIQIANRFL